MKKFVLCASSAAESAAPALMALGLTPVPLPPCGSLPGPVRDHADMLVYKLRSGALLTFECYYNDNRALFDGLGVKIELEGRAPGSVYPRDITLDALRIGGTVFGRTDFMSEKIIADADRAVYIKQGYARCSACVIGERSVITADRTIAKAAEAEGARVTLIQSGGIELKGYDSGFIGGASGNAGGYVIFFGDVFHHPSAGAIIEAVRREGKEILRLFDGPLRDCGGLVVV